MVRRASLAGQWPPKGTHDLSFVLLVVSPDVDWPVVTSHTHQSRKPAPLIVSACTREQRTNIRALATLWMLSSGCMPLSPSSCSMIDLGLGRAVENYCTPTRAQPQDTHSKASNQRRDREGSRKLKLLQPQPASARPLVASWINHRFALANHLVPGPTRRQARSNSKFGTQASASPAAGLLVPTLTLLMQRSNTGLL